MKKLLLIALVVSGLAFVPVERSDAQVSVGIGVGPGYYGYLWIPSPVLPPGTVRDLRQMAATKTTFVILNACLRLYTFTKSDRARIVFAGWQMMQP